MRKLAVDRAVYPVDDGAMTCRFFSRNPAWKELGAKENERNKMQLGATPESFFGDGRRKIFRYYYKT